MIHGSKIKIFVTLLNNMVIGLLFYSALKGLKLLKSSLQLLKSLLKHKYISEALSKTICTKNEGWLEWKMTSVSVEMLI